VIHPSGVGPPWSVWSVVRGSWSVVRVRGPWFVSVVHRESRRGDERESLLAGQRPIRPNRISMGKQWLCHGSVPKKMRIPPLIRAEQVIGWLLGSNGAPAASLGAR
jgi:hypothetical protein